MRSVFLILLIVQLYAQSLKGQIKSYSLSLYFEINEYSSARNNARLDSLLRAAGSSFKKFKLYAYADFLASSQYNQQLSHKRLEAVKQHILRSEGKNALIVETKAFGEDFSKENQSLSGEPLQRRVDVLIEVQEERKKMSKEPLETQQKTEKPIKKTQPKNETSSTKRDITDLEKGESLAIEGLSFIPGRHILMKSSIPVLEELLTTLKENPQLKIEVQGHICCLSAEETDGIDLDTGESKLSENRALAVYNYLIKNGIDAERLSYKGYGHQNPKIIFEKSPEDEQVNRRVEIKVLEN